METKEKEEEGVKQIFHVFNRGVKKHTVFKDDSDFKRFAYGLYRINNKEGALRGSYDQKLSEWPKQNKIVEILKWSLLPNHFHMLVYGEDDQAGEFSRRIADSYAKYSNIKYEESGHVFQNKTQRKPIIHNSQYLYIPYYVELNPLDVKFPDWKKLGTSDVHKAVEFVRNYRWSSLRNYLGANDEFEEVINKELFYELYDANPQEYEKELKEWIKEIPNLETFGKIKINE